MNNFLNIGLEAVKKAGTVIQKYYEEDVEYALKTDDSPVTLADKEAEEIIKATILQEFPDHGFMGEEGGKEKSESPYIWIIDPIDGTKNFIRKLPYFATQLALLKDGQFVLGISHAPALSETMYAVGGEGAFLNDKPVHVSSIDRLSQAYVSHGSLRLFDKHDQTKQLAMLSKIPMGCRCFGDYWSYQLLAMGKIDVVIEADNKIWDVAAVKTIIEEAGGKVTDIHGNELSRESTSCVATNGLLHEEILEYFN